MTALHDYARAHTALDRVGAAVHGLQASRREMAVIAGDQADVVRHLDFALQEARKAYREIEARIATMGRALRVPR